MANHKSAKKRSRQSKTRNLINKSISSQVKSSINILKKSLEKKDPKELEKSLSKVNSALSKAVKRGLIKKQHLSRKLSSFSTQIKKIV